MKKITLITTLLLGLKLYAFNPASYLNEGSTSLALAGSDLAAGSGISGLLANSAMLPSKNMIYYGFSLGAYSDSVDIAPLSLAGSLAWKNLVFAGGNVQSVLPGMLESPILINRMFVTLKSDFKGFNWMARFNFYLSDYREMDRQYGTGRSFDTGFAWGRTFKVGAWYRYRAVIKWQQNADMIVFTSLPSVIRAGISLDKTAGKADTALYLNYEHILPTVRHLEFETRHRILYKNEHVLSLGGSVSLKAGNNRLDLRTGFRLAENTQFLDLAASSYDVFWGLGAGFRLGKVPLSIEASYNQNLISDIIRRAALSVSYTGREESK